MSTKEVREQKAREERLIQQLVQMEGRFRAMDRMFRALAASCKRTIEQISVNASLNNRAKHITVMTSVKKAIVREREQVHFENFFKTRLILTSGKTLGLGTKEITDYYSALMGCNIPRHVVLACMRKMGYQTGPINTYRAGADDDDEGYRTTYRGFKGLMPRDNKHLNQTIREWATQKEFAPNYTSRETEFLNLELAEQALNPYKYDVEEALEKESFNPDNDPEIEAAVDLMDIPYTEDIQL